MGRTLTSTKFLTGVSHDTAGDIKFDGRNSYLYDAEGRVCAVSNSSTSAEYLYDADGNLAAIGSTSSPSCNPSSDGFSITNSYVRGLNGEQVSETNGAGHWYHTNVFANGQLLATYGASETFFALNDWLGTKRAEVTPDGGLATFASLPFGNDQTTAGNLPDATEQHYTGKEHDSRSGNETFKYRDYASSVGRWLSPDPSGLTYADPTDPQSLNLYSYVRGNPLILIDPSGLWLVLKCGADAASYTESKSPDGHGVYQQSAEVDAGKCSAIDDGRGRYNGFIPQLPGGQAHFELTAMNFAPNSWWESKQAKCLLQAGKDKGLSIGLDVLGAVPVVGNAASGASAVVRVAVAADHAVTKPAVALTSGAYGAFGAMSAGSHNPADSLAGAGSAGIGVGLALADASLDGTKAIPIVGNAVSVLTLGWDGYQAYKDYEACMAKSD